MALRLPKLKDLELHGLFCSVSVSTDNDDLGFERLKPTMLFYGRGMMLPFPNRAMLESFALGGHFRAPDGRNWQLPSTGQGGLRRRLELSACWQSMWPFGNDVVNFRRHFREEICEQKDGRGQEGFNIIRSKDDESWVWGTGDSA